MKLSKRLLTILRNRFDTDIKIAFKSFKVKSYFNLKATLPPLFRANVVYQYTCPCERDTSYIGMTSRQFFARIEDHVSHLSTPSNSAIKAHLNQCQKCYATKPKTKNFKILKQGRSSFEIGTVEALLIRLKKPTLNLQLGYTLGAKSRLQCFH